MMSMLKELLTSKKAVAAVSGVLIVLAARVGLNLPEGATQEITGIVIAYLVGQGFADFGKWAKV